MPRSVDRLVDTALNLIAEGDYENAEGILLQVLDVEPDHARAKDALAQVQGAFGATEPSFVADSPETLANAPPSDTPTSGFGATPVFAQAQVFAAADQLAGAGPDASALSTASDPSMFATWPASAAPQAQGGLQAPAPTLGTINDQPLPGAPGIPLQTEPAVPASFARELLARADALDTQPPVVPDLVFNEDGDVVTPLSTRSRASDTAEDTEHAPAFDLGDHDSVGHQTDDAEATFANDPGHTEDEAAYAPTPPPGGVRDEVAPPEPTPPEPLPPGADPEHDAVPTAEKTPRELPLLNDLPHGARESGSAHESGAHESGADESGAGELGAAAAGSLPTPAAPKPAEPLRVGPVEARESRTDRHLSLVPASVGPSTQPQLPPVSEQLAREWELEVLTGAHTGVVLTIGRRPLMIGKGLGGLDVEEDFFVSPAHASFFIRHDDLWVSDGGGPSGTWLSIQQPEWVNPGGSFSVGLQRFRYLGPLETGSNEVPWPYGAPRPAATWRLEHVLLGDRPGQIWLARGAITVGRGGTIAFAEDESLAQVHAELRPANAALEVLDRSNDGGVFVQIGSGGERRVPAGAKVRLGATVLRARVK